MIDTLCAGEEIPAIKTIALVSGELDQEITELEKILRIGELKEEGETPPQDKLTDLVNFLQTEIRRLKNIKQNLKILG